MDDTEQILELNADTMRRINSKDYTEDQIEAWLSMRNSERLRAAISAGYITVCADSENDEVLGYGSRLNDEIHALYVSSQQQNEGIGTRILDRMEQDAISEGVKELHFHSTITALPFYTSKGYRAISKHQVPLTDGKMLDTVKVSKFLCTKMENE